MRPEKLQAARVIRSPAPQTAELPAGFPAAPCRNRRRKIENSALSRLNLAGWRVAKKDSAKNALVVDIHARVRESYRRLIAPF